MMMKSKTTRLLLVTACAAVSQLAGCDASESSGDNVVLRTTHNQTEVVTVQAANGERQTVLIDAEGEERVAVTRDSQGNYTATAGEREMSPEPWSTFGDELQPMHAVLHGLGAGLSNGGAQAGATPDDASFQTSSGPLAASYSDSRSCNDGISGGRKYGHWVTLDTNPVVGFSSAQCTAYANSCGGNAQVSAYGGAYPLQYGFMTYCLFTTNP